MPHQPSTPHLAPHVASNLSQLRVCEGPRSNYSAEFSCRTHDEYEMWYNHLQMYAKNGTGASTEGDGEEPASEEEGVNGDEAAAQEEAERKRLEIEEKLK